jgi:hypothetical protein
VFGFLARPRDLTRPPSTMLHPSKGFPRQQRSALAGFCPLIVHHPRMVRSRGLSPLVESVASFSCCHAKEPDPPLGFSLVITASPLPVVGAVVPKDEGSRDRGHLRSGSARSQVRRSGFWVGFVPPRGPSVRWTGFCGAIRVGRLRPHAGRQGPGVACSRGSDLSSSLAGRGVAIGSCDPRPPTVWMRHRGRWGAHDGASRGWLGAGSDLLPHE